MLAKSIPYNFGRPLVGRSCSLEKVGFPTFSTRWQSAYGGLVDCARRRQPASRQCMPAFLNRNERRNAATIEVAERPESPLVASAEAKPLQNKKRPFPEIPKSMGPKVSKGRPESPLVASAEAKSSVLASMHSITSDCRKTPGRCRRGRSPSDFYSYPTALPAGRVVDFACKINSLHLRTTSGWPKVPSRKSGENHFFDTLPLHPHGSSVLTNFTI